MAKIIETDDKVKISGSFTAGDWRRRKKHLTLGENSENWQSAYNDFFVERLYTRYFNPIQQIINLKLGKGEGFAVVALQCSLIEFLSTTLEGKNLTLDKKGGDNTYRPYEAKIFFKKFLREQNPFLKYFPCEDNETDCPNDPANDFYSNVRCGLLHEARTKNYWKIHEGIIDGPAICYNSDTNKIIYRDRLQSELEKFVKSYGKRLQHCKKLQEAFKTKIEGLCHE